MSRPAFILDRVAPRRASAAALVLAVGVLVLFARTGGHDFIVYDDPLYVRKNAVVQQGLTRAGVRWAFTTFAGGNWHPLTWLSHMLDVELFGVAPGPHHLVNVLFHAASAALLLLLLAALTGSVGRSAAVAALFALHPLHVESVAWVAERKDVLSVFFWMLTTLAYLAFVRTRLRHWYALTGAFLTLGLLAKATLVTLPFTLLLLDAWPLGRVRDPLRERGAVVALLREKVPLLIPTGVKAVLTVYAPFATGILRQDAAFSLGTKISNALLSLVAYLKLTVWPAGLAIIYPYPDSFPPAKVAGAVALLAALTAVAVLGVRRRPWLVVGWLWYLVTLAPVLGLIQIGPSAMADRYTYVPLVGIFTAVVWEAADRAGRRPRGGRALAAAAALAIAACFAASWRQIAYWRDSVTLFERAVASTRDNYAAMTHLAVVLREAGRPEEANALLERALEINPFFPMALNNYGVALGNQGEHRDAVERFNDLVAIVPQDPRARANLGYALLWDGRPLEALEVFREVRTMKPDDADPYLELAHALVDEGAAAKGVEFYGGLVERRGEDPGLLLGLGISLLGAGRPDRALEVLQRSVALHPASARAHHQLGRAFLFLGRPQEAEAQYRASLALNPQQVGALNSLGALLAARDDLDGAAELFRRATVADATNAVSFYNLAVAHLQQGDRKVARALLERALLNDPEYERPREILRVVFGVEDPEAVPPAAGAGPSLPPRQ